MTFVGTRPEVAKYVKKYTKEMYATLLLPAGVTSEASIEFKDEEQLLGGINGDKADWMYIKKVMPAKMRWNLKEIQNFSLCQEGLLLFRTVKAVLK